MSVAAYHRGVAARLNRAVERMEAHGNFANHVRIARLKAERHARRAATAARWEKMAATPLAERPGGYPGDPFNSRLKVSAVG